MSVVLDASALLALILDEPGAQRVEPVLPDAIISSVNLCEVVSKLQDKGMRDANILRVLATLDLDVRPQTQEQAIAAGLLRRVTRSVGLSLGDRACLALAQSLAVPAYTTETRWPEIADACGVVVERIR